jgi:diadenosine tetraphosphate (Ap4A) HIT family hydrolase
MILGDEHKENFLELTAKDFSDISYLINWAIKKWEIKGGGIAMRFGDIDYTGASVSHLHFHIISPQRKMSVNFPIG